MGSIGKDGLELIQICPRTWEIMQPYFWFYETNRKLGRWNAYLSKAEIMVSWFHFLVYLYRRKTRDHDAAELETVLHIFKSSVWESLKVTAWDDYVDIAYQPYFEMGQT